MKASIHVLALSVFVLGLAVTHTQGADLVSHYPEKTALYFEWCGADQASKAIDGSSFGKLINEPEVKAFRGKIAETVSGYLPVLGMATGKMPVVRAGLDALWLCWTKPGAVGIVGVEVTLFGQAPGIVWTLEAGDQAEAMRKSMETLFAAIPGMPEATDGTWEGISVRLFQPAYVPALQLSAADGRFMMIVGDVAAKTIASVKAGEPSLETNPIFKQCRQQMKYDKDRTLTFAWVNVDEIRNFAHEIYELQTAEEQFPESVETILEQTGLNSLHCLSRSIRMTKDGGFINAGYIGISDTQKGLGKLLSAAPLTDDDYKFVPKDATFAVLLNKDMAATVEEVLRLADVIHPDVRAMINLGITEVEAKTRLKLLENVFPAFGDTIIVYDAPSDGGIFGSGTTVVIETKDTTEVVRTLKRFIRLIAKETNNGTVFVKDTEFREHKIHYTNFMGGQMPVSPAWVEYEGRLIVGLFPQIVMQTIDRLESSDAKKQSILANEAFKRARKQLPGNASYISYVDTESLYTLVDGIILPAWAAVCGQLQKMTLDLDVSILPRQSVVKRHLFPDVRAFAATENGFICENYGPLPISLPEVAAHAGLASLGGAAMALKEQHQTTSEDPFMQQLEEIDSQPLDEPSQKTGDAEENPSRAPGQMAKKRMSKQAMAPGGSIAVALDFYRVDCGRYPTTEEGLNALMEKPESLKEEQWKGPYIRDAKVLVDPWGNPVFYISDGTRFTMLIAGPDGKANTADDIRHTPREQ